MSLIYFAEIQLKADCFKSACRAVDAIVDETLGEEGCEAFIPHRAADGPPTLYIYERWRDRDAFDFHHAQPYTRDIFEKYKDWLAHPVRMTELQAELA